MKILAGAIITLMLVAGFNPLVDEVTAIGEHENATSHDVILYNTFPIVYAAMCLCCAGATLYWMWRR